MQSRRQLLQQAFVVPVAVRSLHPRVRPFECRIVSELDCLSEESAAGYRFAIERHKPRFPVSGRTLVFAAGRTISKDRLLSLHSLAISGAWLVWENSPSIRDEQELIHQQELFRNIFDLRLARPRGVEHGAGNASYIRYDLPRPAMIRTFLRVTPIECPPEQAIAYYEGEAIAARKRLGRGGIIFLGSLLGPHLQAEDRDASRLAVALLETAL